MRLAPLPNIITKPLIEAALKEDYGRLGDITSHAVVDENATAFGEFNAREDGILSGVEIAKLTFEIVDPTIEFDISINDGETVNAGDVIAKVSGNARAILLAERVALNFMGHLSGIASKTNKFVKRCHGTNTRITCTRKTTPLLRSVEKYAVRCGGGFNHRFALDDAIMIKDNHIVVAGGVAKAVNLAKKHAGHLVKIEVEIDYLTQLDEAINAKADVILLDNMSLDDMQKAAQTADLSAAKSFLRGYFNVPIH
ncbi:MAG: carboxylating nicotinate-nucleotide diphosphorylase, partial [Rhizobiales bacterium]|nr:carboxylating nicotinate-nucleotide diphosphorylase [Hyphomicrobiales bacterium]